MGTCVLHKKIIQSTHPVITGSDEQNGSNDKNISVNYCIHDFNYKIF